MVNTELQSLMTGLSDKNCLKIGGEKLDLNCLTAFWLQVLYIMVAVKSAT